MGSSVSASQNGESPLERLLGLRIRLNTEVIVFTVLIILAILTRFYNLGARTMSHDETTHVYFSWQYEQGKGYQHDPLSHGPLQFHLIALSYFLLGANDASARVPAAVFGVLAVGMVWLFRRWLGRRGTWVAAALMLVSPFMLYYSRYARNEAFVVVEALLMMWACFRYLETRQAKWLYILTAALALQYATKETAFIYVAEILIFFAGVFVYETIKKPWDQAVHRIWFIAGVIAAALGGSVATLSFLSQRTSAGEAPDVGPSPLIGLGMLLAVIGLVLILAALFMNFGRRLRTEFPSLDILIITLTMTLPQVGALPAQALGWNPLTYDDPAILSRTISVVIALSIVAAGLGLVWDWRRWTIAAGVFLAIFIPLYTSLFTYPFGFFTGLVASLGYWLVQQGVQRGSQPLYYYVLIQIPFYEFLPAIGSLMAGWIGLKALVSPPTDAGSRSTADETGQEAKMSPNLVIVYFGYWALLSIAAYSYAGERMPWLTVHIALPMILLAGWAIGRKLDSIEWSQVLSERGALLGLLGFLALIGLARAVGYLLGSPTPFQGAELDQLETTTGLITSAAVGIGAGVAVYLLGRQWKIGQLGNLAGIVVLAVLFVVTVRTSFRASYVNYDNAEEFLVYAHGAPGPKLALQEIEELSRRTTGGLNMDIGYDNETLYPYWWYLRDFPNAHYFADSPGHDLQNYPLVLAGGGNWAKVEPILRDRYYMLEYTRLWWPMQDYFDLTWERVWGAISSPGYRAALWDMWFNRDYTAYGQMVGHSFALRDWDPSEKMRLYIRKDVAATIWQYGIAPTALEPVTFEDPYASKMVTLEADTVIGQTGTEPGQFSHPRGLAIAPDGSLYVADTGNHRIQHLTSSGEVISVWGSFADLSKGEAPGGTFNEPWDVAVAPDGTVYVADTWNHRIQHFTADGQFLGMFGHFGQADTPDAFWGPRAVAIDPSGRIFVSDTGNKRIVVFDSQGNSLGEIGSGGVGLGQLDEPVGLALDTDGNLYVDDTWNQRIQVFNETSPNEFEAVLQWQIDGWFGQSLENKPYISAGPQDQICTTDPESYRVLCFSAKGDFLYGWGEFGQETSQFSLPAGIALDDACGAWVTDSAAGRLMKFTLPGCP
jgi:uncharacterized protein (TIGR03663 family)